MPASAPSPTTSQRVASSAPPAAVLPPAGGITCPSPQKTPTTRRKIRKLRGSDIGHQAAPDGALNWFGFANLQGFRPAGAAPCVGTRPTVERCAHVVQAACPHAAFRALNWFGFANLHRFRPAWAAPCVGTRPTVERCVHVVQAACPHAAFRAPSKLQSGLFSFAPLERRSGFGSRLLCVESCSAGRGHGWPHCKELTETSS